MGQSSKGIWKKKHNLKYIETELKETGKSGRRVKVTVQIKLLKSEAHSFI